MVVCPKQSHKRLFVEVVPVHGQNHQNFPLRIVLIENYHRRQNFQEDNQKTSRGPKFVETGVLCDKRKSYQIEKKAGQVSC